MKGAIVVDASLAAMWVVPEPHSERALALADRWAEEAVVLLAPGLFVAQVTNALYQRVARRELSLGAAQAALDLIWRFAVQVREEPGLPARAMALAHRFDLPATYDCHYVALAERHRCELWTGDRRLERAVGRAFPWVRWVGSS